MRKIVFATIIPSWSVAAIYAAVLMLAGCSSSGDASPENRFNSVPLLNGALALDGDTIQAPDNTRIRLKRIDAPELPEHTCPPYGRKSCVDNDPVWAGKSMQYLQDILNSHVIRCAYDQQEDVYGRKLGECWIIEEDNSWSNINNLMLTSGMAVPYRR